MSIAGHEAEMWEVLRPQEPQGWTTGIMDDQEQDEDEEDGTRLQATESSAMFLGNEEGLRDFKSMK